MYKIRHLSRILYSYYSSAKWLVERKNKVIQEMAKAMLYNKNVARNLWREAVNTACHTVNRVYFRPSTKKTPYEL